MPKLDLKSDDGLRRVCEEAEALMNETPHAEWLQAREDLLRRVRATPAAGRASEEFLRLVWLHKTLAPKPPQTHLDRMSEAIADEGFRNWFARRVAAELPGREAHAARIEALEEMGAEVLERAKPFVRHGPRIMVHAVLSALFPEDLVFMPREDDLFRFHRKGLGLKGHGRNGRFVTVWSIDSGFWPGSNGRRG